MYYLCTYKNKNIHIQGVAWEPRVFRTSSTRLFTNGRVVPQQAFHSWLIAFYYYLSVVTMEPSWTLEHRIFVYDCFVRSGGSIMKKKPPGPQRTVRTPENIERVRQAIQRSPFRSARKHSTALRISDRTVRRILHEELRNQRRPEKGESQFF
ncbi:uncharacterized protein [Euwallacea fornicatus]|uniref:uncharacterized protein n=1 Tax=Euwallacea fornicatus TaxID=995702 RepID=UPI0033902A3A